MTARPDGRLERERRRDLLGAVVASGLAVPLLIACGISVGSGERETELFTRLTVTGDFVPSGALTLTLEYLQQYPVDVEVACDVLDPKKKVGATPLAEEPTPTPATIPRQRVVSSKKLLDILAEPVPGNANGGPFGTATPVAGTIERSFAAPDRPGRYTVRCYTPSDDNNAIRKTITIR